jgi:tRNA-uridine 2-sulfurtransferase
MTWHGSHLVRQVHIARTYRQSGFAKGGYGPPSRYRAQMIETFGDSTRDGDWAAVRLRVDGDRIVEADAPGLERPIVGLTLLEAAAVGGETLAVDALANAIGPVFRAEAQAGRNAVAMSGGVDSAVALLRAGRDAIGVTLRLWLDPEGPDSDRACCSPEAVIAARETCHRLGLPHVTLDLREEFRRAVVTPFVRGYGRGETPNPCIRCNGSFRFAELLAFARRAGCDRLATGHYARVAEHRGRLLLHRGADDTKDQSYMLARLDPKQLGHIWFPLGEQDKDATRAEAASAGLAVAQRAESQEACFLAGDDYRAFLTRNGLEPRAGKVVDEHGKTLGDHDGFWRFTPGQRKGIGVSAPTPLYVLDADAASNAVIVGPHESLARRQVDASGRLYVVDVGRADAKLRYRSPAVGASVSERSGGFTLELDEPAYGVARGQAAVLYEGDAVVGCGLISAARDN